MWSLVGADSILRRDPHDPPGPPSNHEVGRLPIPAIDVLEALGASVGLRLAETPWSLVARVALALDWTRDPFDRLIAAHAIVDGVSLVTADAVLRSRLSNAVWD